MAVVDYTFQNTRLDCRPRFRFELDQVNVHYLNKQIQRREKEKNPEMSDAEGFIDDGFEGVKSSQIDGKHFSLVFL